MITEWKKIAVATVSALLLSVSPAHADVLSEMNRFWQGAAVNTTGPTAFQGQASGHWTLGNLYLRSPVRSEQVATVNLPSFRAGLRLEPMSSRKAASSGLTASASQVIS